MVEQIKDNQNLINDQIVKSINSIPDDQEKCLDVKQKEIETYRKNIITGVRECNRYPLVRELHEKVTSPLYDFVYSLNDQEPEIIFKEMDSLKEELFSNSDFPISKDGSVFNEFMRCYASIYEEKGKYPDSLSCYKTLIENYKKDNNSDFGPIYEVGEFFRLQKKAGEYNSKDAIELYHKYIIEGSDLNKIRNADFSERYACLLEENNRYSEAIDFYKLTYEYGFTGAYVDEEAQKMILEKIDNLQKKL